MSIVTGIQPTVLTTNGKDVKNKSNSCGYLL